MGCFPLRQTTSTFNPKSLQVDLVSEITFIKCDECVKKSSISTLNIPHIEHLPKNDPKHFIYFLCSKFSSLRELSLDDELDDGNPVEIKKIDINKRAFPKKNKRVKFAKVSNSSKELSYEKFKKIQPRRKQSSCENVVAKGKLYNINDLKEKSNTERINTFIFQKGSFQNFKISKFRNRKKHAKSTKFKDFNSNNPTLSTIKSKKSELNNNNEDEEGKVNHSLDVIRSILKEMGN